MPDGRIVPSAHGRVRNRIATLNLKIKRRIEFTGCPLSFSLIDELARNCFLQTLTIAAYDPWQPFNTLWNITWKNNPNMGDWSKQKELAKTASIQGFHYQKLNR
jgi:hypothetical protein